MTCPTPPATISDLRSAAMTSLSLRSTFSRLLTFTASAFVTVLSALFQGTFCPTDTTNLV